MMEGVLAVEMELLWVVAMHWVHSLEMVMRKVEKLLVMQSQGPDGLLDSRPTQLL